MGIQTSAIPIACSFKSPESVSLPSSGAKGTAASKAIIIGGNLFSSSNNTLAETRQTANTEGQATWRSLMSILSSMFWAKRSR